MYYINFKSFHDIVNDAAWDHYSIIPPANINTVSGNPRARTRPESNHSLLGLRPNCPQIMCKSAEALRYPADREARKFTKQSETCNFFSGGNKSGWHFPCKALHLYQICSEVMDTFSRNKLTTTEELHTRVMLGGTKCFSWANILMA